MVVNQDFAIREAPVQLAALSVRLQTHVWGGLSTLVVMTRSLLLQPNFLIASPMTISDCPPA